MLIVTIHIINFLYKIFNDIKVVSLIVLVSYRDAHQYDGGGDVDDDRVNCAYCYCYALRVTF